MSIVGSLLHDAAAGYRKVTQVNQQLQNNVKYSLTHKPVWSRQGDPPLLSRKALSAAANSAYGIDGVKAAIKKPSLGNIAMAGIGLPLFGGEGAPLRRAALDTAVRDGKVAGGAVKVTRMSTAEQAKYRESLSGVKKATTRDLIEQHGQQGLYIPKGQEGLDKLLELAKHPGHTNTTFYPHEGPPGVARELRKLEGTTTKYVVTPDGKIGVGDLGLHHDHIMKRMGVTRPMDVIQGELHHEQPDIGAKARAFTGRSIMDELGVGQRSQNRTQTAAINDWLTKANGEGYSPVRTGATATNGRVSLGGDLIDNRRATALAKRLADEPNPLKPPPTALQLAGKRPTLEGKRTSFGVLPGGMGKGTGKVDAPYSIATGMNLPKVGPGPKRLDPSTAPRDVREPRFIPTDAVEKAKRSKLLDTRQAVREKKVAEARKERERVAKLQPKPYGGKH